MHNERQIAKLLHSDYGEASNPFHHSPLTTHHSPTYNVHKGGTEMAEKVTKRSEDYSQWYLDIVQQAKLAENSDVRGCMVIRPHGYAIWEKMQGALDRMFKDSGHVNAYFPLFIPKSFLAKEEQMAEGFAKEC